MIEKLKAALERFLFEGQPGSLLRRRLLVPARILYALLRDLADGQMNLRAMSLVYTTLLSLVPLLAITFSVLKGFGVHNQIEPLLLHVFAPLGEQATEVVHRIIGFVNNMQVGVLGSVGLGLLLFTVISLMQKIERSLNEIWQVPHDRPFAERFSGYLSILLIGPVLVFSSLGVTASISSSSVVQTIAAIEPFGDLLHAGGRLLPYIMVMIAFTVIYKLMPNTHVRFVSAAIGGVAAGVLWETVGWAFAAYVVRSSNYPAIYSAFATLLLFMIWLYVSWLILLIGAAVAFYHQHPEYVATRRVQLVLSANAQERLALAVAALITRHFQSGTAPWTASGLARHFLLPEAIVVNLLEILQRNGFVTPTRGDPPGYVPARPPEQIGAAEVLLAVRAAGRGDRRMDMALAEQAPVLRAAQAADSAMIQALAGRSLLDLAGEAGQGETTPGDSAGMARDEPVGAPPGAGDGVVLGADGAAREAAEDTGARDTGARDAAADGGAAAGPPGSRDKPPARAAAGDRRAG